MPTNCNVPAISSTRGSTTFGGPLSDCVVWLRPVVRGRARRGALPCVGAVGVDMSAPSEPRRPDFGLLADALGHLQSGERTLRNAGFVESAEEVRRGINRVRSDFMVAWETMLRAEGRWSDDASSQRLQMTMARLYLGEI